MARTNIDVQGVLNSSWQVNAAKSTANGVRSDLDWMRGQISSAILNRNNLRERLRKVSVNISNVESRMNRIRITAENGAKRFYNTDRRVAVWKSSMTEEIAKKYVRGVGLGSLVSAEVVKQVVDKVELEKFDNNKDVELTDSQKKAILKALKNNDKRAALAAIGISFSSTMNSEEKNLANTLWNDLCEGFKKNIINEGKTGFVNEILESGGNWISQVVAGRININHAVAQGPATGNSFVILDPSVASKTATMTQGVATGLKIGIPIVGGIIDFAGMKMNGEETGDALVKATAHVGIGLAGGKAGAAIGAAIGSVIPGAGTAVGGAIGFVAGVAITAVGNAVFDAVYDNREAIAETISDTWNAATEWVEETGKQVGEAVNKAVDKTKDFFSDVGEAWSSGWKSLGSIFG